MPKFPETILFVGKNEETAYLYVVKGIVVCEKYAEATKRYSLTYIDKNTNVVESQKPLIVEFKRKMPNALKEAYLALYLYQNKKTG